jgi:choline dehydrogenase-like flavoprotein
VPADLAADVVVIGAGPAGAAATWRLARAGLSVICLERGHWFDHAALAHGTPGYERRRAGRFNDNPNIRQGDDDYPIDDSDSPIKVTIGNAVGGGSIYWAAHIPRYRPEDFRVHSLDGVAADWPIGYADLDPYYEINESMMGLAAVPGDPAGPPRCAQPLPMPGVGPAGRGMAAAFDRLGWHWWPVDLAVGADDLSAEPCRHVGPCEPGCPTRRRSGADHAYLRPALAAGARLVTGARVTALEQEANGRVRAAVAATDAGTIRVRADRFVLAANGIGTPRLLLLSATSACPNGLANRSGQVGRNLMLHPHARVDARFPQPLGSWAVGRKAGLVCLEFLATRPEHGFPRGFKMQFSAGPGPAALANGVAAAAALPWGAGHHEGFLARFDRIAGLTICIEDLPEPGNCITLSDDLRDRDGAAAPRLSYRVSDVSRHMLDFAMDRAADALRAAGGTDIVRDRLKAQAGFHLMGTARMGASRETSVVDGYGGCHDVSNLFIVDSSVFVTASAMNPTATAQAFALRAADHIAGRRHSD